MSASIDTGKTAIIQIQTGQAPVPEVTSAQVGGKAWGLLRMIRAGIKVPPGFVLGTACCRQYFKKGDRLSKNRLDEIKQQIHWLEKTTGKAFGSKRNPLILSVRSGAPVSMPGMMDSLLNIGLNDETVRGLIRSTGNPRLAWDSYRRLIQTYAEVLHTAKSTEFDEILKHYLKQDGLKYTCEMDSVSFRNLCTELIHTFRSVTGEDFPQDPWQQLFSAVSVIFDSWFSQRAKTYREINHIDSSTGTACLIQAMVFGNSGDNSGSGVGFTRNPADGTNELYIDYLANAQGEDIVSGRHDVDDVHTLQRKLPEVASELQQIKKRLETEFSDMQDFEFTVQQGDLYLLQTRSGKRTPLATLRIAIDLFDEKLISSREALALTDTIDLDKLYVSRLKQIPKTVSCASGIPASTGVTNGLIALDEQQATLIHKHGDPVVLVRYETSTDDIGAMNLADAVVTVTGGRTSHAAVVARQLGTACVVGCHDIKIDLDQRCIRIDNQTCPEGSEMTVDAENGRIYPGKLEIERRRPDELLKRIGQWRSSSSSQAESITGT